MLITEYEQLPLQMKNAAVRPYLEELLRKKRTLLLKRVVDCLLCATAFLLSLPFFLLFALLVKLTSRGPAFFRQERVGRDLKPFSILKFRTMTADADQKGVQLTTGDDARITGFGKFLRAINMDEMPQLLNVLKGEMSLIGTRPEVSRYVGEYTDEMYATLLLAPGMLSMASVKYKNENSLLSEAGDPQRVYVEEILPDKMQYNLAYLKEISLRTDFRILGQSIAAAFRKG